MDQLSSVYNVKIIVQDMGFYRKQTSPYVWNITQLNLSVQIQYSLFTPRYTDTSDTCFFREKQQSDMLCKSSWLKEKCDPRST